MKYSSSELKRLYEKLESEFPKSIQEAIRLAEGIVDPYDSPTDKCWSIIWNKPLFANTKVPIAAKYVKYLEDNQMAAFDEWADEDTIDILHTGKGSSVTSFEFASDRAKEIRENSGIAPHRLFAIQNGARLLKSRAGRSKYPFSDLSPNISSNKKAFLSFKAEFGKFWGDITVLHLLTDMGLAVKPDLHLVNTVNHLTGSNYDGVPKLKECLEINEVALSISQNLFGTDSPYDLRITDKVLMEVSMKILKNVEDNSGN